MPNFLIQRIINIGLGSLGAQAFAVALGGVVQTVALAHIIHIYQLTVRTNRVIVRGAGATLIPVHHAFAALHTTALTQPDFVIVGIAFLIRVRTAPAVIVDALTLRIGRNTNIANVKFPAQTAGGVV